MALQSRHTRRRVGVSPHADSKQSVKPIRIWMHVGDRDLMNPNIMRDDMHDWVLANERMATVLATKATIPIRFARDSGHCDRSVKAQTLPNALEFGGRTTR